MRGQAQQIDPQVVDIERQESASLDGIGVEDDPASTTDGADLGDRLDGADLVVGVHDRDQGGVLVNGRLDVGRVDAAISVDRQVGHPEAGALHDCAGVEDRLVLHAAGDDMASLGARGPGGTLDGKVVGLAAAAGEDDLARLGTQDRGDLLACLVETLPSPPAAAWGLEALPKCSVRYGSIASSTSALSGVVAAWSR